MNEVQILPLDGADTIGGSKILIEDENYRALLDFGTNFHKLNRYYEEFLKPRSLCGVLDYIEMGVLPDAKGLYREDLIHPDVKLTGPDIGKLDAVFISHAHVDHMGALGFLKIEVPVITSLMSACIMKAMQDSGSTDLGSDGVYASLRGCRDNRGNKVLHVISQGEMPGRNFSIAEGKPAKSFNDFWEFHPPSAMSGKAKKSLVPGKLMDNLPGIEYNACPVDHSIKGACGFILKTASGNIVYTGDIRLHGIKGKKTKEFINKARKANPRALIVEGTALGRPAEEQVSENDVKTNAEQLVSEMKDDLVIADFGPRNIERLEIFQKIAKESGRKLVVTGKDAYLLNAMRIADSSVPIPGNDMLIYNCPRSSYGKWEEWIFDERFKDCSANPVDVHNSPGDFLLAFSFWDVKHLIDIKPEKGHYIYSSSEAHSEEQEIDFQRLANWLKKFNIKKYGFDVDSDGKPSFPRGLHASGHASENDLKEIIEGIAPEIIIPVHTEHPEWFADNFGNEFKTIIPKKSIWIEI